MKQIARALKAGDIETFQTLYAKALLEIVSYYDLVNEHSYHLFMLAICMSLEASYEIVSNKEIGRGRPDIYLKSKCHKRDIILDLKYVKKVLYEKEPACLKKLAETALRQIEYQKYAISTRISEDDPTSIGGKRNHLKQNERQWWAQRNRYPPLT